MIVLDLPKSVERERAVGAVRSTLDPNKRFLKDRSGYKQDYQKAILADANKKAADSVAPDNGRPRTSLEAQRGIVLQSSTIMDRLKSLNPNLIFERSVARPQFIGIYIQSSNPDHQPEGKAFTGVTFSHGVNPEFAVVKKSEDFVSPDGTLHPGQCTGIVHPGWRTVLSRLIRYGFINKARAEVLFGACGTSEFWARQLGHRS